MLTRGRRGRYFQRGVSAAGIEALPGVPTPPAPAWVIPVGALIYADFVNSRYFVGEQVRTAAEVVVENTDWDDFDPVTDITVDGLIGNPVISPAYITPLLTAYSAVIGLVAGNGQVTWEMVDLPDFASEELAQLEADVGGGGGHLSLTNWVRWEYNASGWHETQPDIGKIPAEGVSKVGLTYNEGAKHAICLDGGAVSSQVPPSRGAAATDIVIYVTAPTAIKTITIYAEKTDVALRALTA